LGSPGRETISVPASARLGTGSSICGSHQSGPPS
jgi:hypothetical protein